MKIFAKALFISFVISVVFSMIPFSAQCKNLSDEVFRLHILADSDSQQAQSLKIKVRDSVLAYTQRLYKGCDSAEEAQRLTSLNLKSIADKAKQTVAKEGFDLPVKAEIRRMYFNTRHYGKVNMPSGVYNALRITIGEGKGHNWWCVMYPSLCVGASTNYKELKSKTSNDEYRLMTDEGCEFKLKIVEYFQNICSIFS